MDAGVVIHGQQDGEEGGGHVTWKEEEGMKWGVGEARQSERVRSAREMQEELEGDGERVELLEERRMRRVELSPPQTSCRLHHTLTAPRDMYLGGGSSSSGISVLPESVVDEGDTARPYTVGGPARVERARETRVDDEGDEGAAEGARRVEDEATAGATRERRKGEGAAAVVWAVR